MHPNQRTALVVDDSRSARFALRKYLESHAFKVDTAESAHAAYAWLAAQTPDLIFLDHVMPGEDGFEALRQIKANPQTAAIPVVICSSNEGSSFADQARRQGATDVLQKPPTAEQLQRVLQHIEAAVQRGADNEPNHPADLPADSRASAAADVAPEAPALPASGAARGSPTPAPMAAELPPEAAAASLRGELDALRAGSVQQRADTAAMADALDARVTAIEARLSAMEQRLAANLKTLRKQQDQEIELLRRQHDKDDDARRRQHEQELELLRKQFDGDLRAVHQQFAAELAAGLKTSREQAVADIRDSLLRALRA